MTNCVITETTLLDGETEESRTLPETRDIVELLSEFVPITTLL